MKRGRAVALRRGRAAALKARESSTQRRPRAPRARDQGLRQRRRRARARGRSGVEACGSARRHRVPWQADCGLRAARATRHPLACSGRSAGRGRHSPGTSVARARAAPAASAPLATARFPGDPPHHSCSAPLRPLAACLRARASRPQATARSRARAALQGAERRGAGGSPGGHPCEPGGGGVRGGRRGVRRRGTPCLSVHRIPAHRPPIQKNCARARPTFRHRFTTATRTAQGFMGHHHSCALALAWPIVLSPGTTPATKGPRK